MKVNWNKKSKETSIIFYGSVLKIMKKWELKNSKWELCCFFANYPPKICINFEIHGVNKMTPKLLSEVEPVITTICNKHNLSSKMKIKGTTVNYTLWTKFTE